MPRYSIGLDLGTTNSAVSYFDCHLTEGRPEQSMLGIPQLTAPGTVESRSLLPSFLYLPHDGEFPAGSLSLPWETSPAQGIAGEFARTHGTQVPMRLVASAKSWLCHPGVDRASPLLPWQAPAEVPRLSPLDVSARYLAHLRQAWDQQFPDSPLADQDVVLTVPASFDAAARDLTRRAAAQAGLPHLTLLEEPQAAFYAWCEAMGGSFRKQIQPGDVVLVVDVGGGTCDFSLIAVTDQDGEVALTRVAVGDHILLGGDNMDLALAHTVNAQLAAAGKKLDPWQFRALTFACRQAKERLYLDPKLSRAPLVVPGRGSALVGGTLKAELRREDLEAILTDGFFPRVRATDLPQTARRTGLAQMALPYAQDPAVTRHLAGFLTRQARALAEAPHSPIPVHGQSLVHPTAVLFNGGVFRATALQHRVLEVLNDWLAADGGSPAKVLDGAELDLAVARGAAYYGWVRQGHGLRIRGGTARAYYVGVETAMPAVPGIAPPLNALCVAPFGMEEGTQAEVPPQEFGLVVGEPTQFRFFASSVRREDQVGHVLESATSRDDLEEIAPLETTLPVTAHPAGELVPVNLQAAVTEVGTLELRCLERNGPGQWRLELNVRMKD